MTRKSSSKTRSTEEDSRQRSKRPYPVQVEPEAREWIDPAQETPPKDIDVEEHHAEEQHKVPDIQTDKKVEKIARILKMLTEIRIIVRLYVVLPKRTKKRKDVLQYPMERRRLTKVRTSSTVKHCAP